MEAVKPVVRFAPSPNGYLHLGHAFSALLNYQFAVQHGGQFLLRIEDIDIGRSRPEFEQAIYDDLDWLITLVNRKIKNLENHIPYGIFKA